MSLASFMKKLDYIDALRGLAVLSVLVLHCLHGLLENFPGSVKNIVANGGRGVQLFYIVSAFTIFLSYSKRNQFEKFVDLNFFIRRFFRIAPMYYVAIIYYLFQNGLWMRNSFGYDVELNHWSIISNLFFFHGVYPYWLNTVVPVGWSVSIEVFFYCMIPFLFRRIKTINHAIILFIISLAVGACLSNYILASNIIGDRLNAEIFVFFYLPNHLPVFACGIILYFLICQPRQSLNINPSLLFLVALLFLGDLATEKRLFMATFTNHILFSIAFVLLTYALSKRAFTIVVNPVTRYLGKISYSLYLVHMGVLYWIEKLNLSTITAQNSQTATVVEFVMRFVLLSVGSVLLATLFYHVVEVPFQKLGKRLIARHEGRQQAEVGQLSLAK